MYLVAIAWLYVVLMMSLAEASSAQGTVLGAVFTFVLYGVLPLSIVMYLLGTPGRRAARRRAQALSESATAATESGDLAKAPGASGEADRGDHAAGQRLPPVRKEA